MMETLKITERHCIIGMLVLYLFTTSWLLTIPYDPMKGVPDEPSIPQITVNDRIDVYGRFIWDDKNADQLAEADEIFIGIKSGTSDRIEMVDGGNGQGELYAIFTVAQLLEHPTSYKDALVRVENGTVEPVRTLLEGQRVNGRSACATALMIVL